MAEEKVTKKAPAKKAEAPKAEVKEAAPKAEAPKKVAKKSTGNKKAAISSRLKDRYEAEIKKALPSDSEFAQRVIDKYLGSLDDEE